MEPKRVVITGMGVISCIGQDVDTFWKNLINGVCGIDYVEAFKDMPVTFAGKVRDFDAEKYGMDTPLSNKHAKMLAEKASELTKTITDKAKGSTEQAADSAKAAVKNAADSLSNKVSETAEKAKDAAIAAKDAAVKTFENGKSSSSTNSSSTAKK